MNNCIENVTSTILQVFKVRCKDIVSYTSTGAPTMDWPGEHACKDSVCLTMSRKPRISVTSQRPGHKKVIVCLAISQGWAAVIVKIL